MLVAMVVAAAASLLLRYALGPNSPGGNLLTALWILVPYLALVAVVLLAERRTSLFATLIATLLGAAGASTPLLMLQLVDSATATQLIPVYQAGTAVLLVAIGRRLLSQMEPVGLI